MSDSPGELAPIPDAAPRGSPATARVAATVPVGRLLDYAIPTELLAELQVGIRVLVPVGPRKVPGFVVEIVGPPAEGVELKSVIRILEPRPSLTGTTLPLGLWVAGHYGAPPGESLQALVPGAVRRGPKTREESWVELTDAHHAAALLETHREDASWASRRKILRCLIEDQGGRRQSELLRAAGVSASPIRTLERLGVLRTRKVAAASDPFADLHPQRGEPPELTEDQRRSLDHLLPALRTRRYSAALLHGVTGSGKTEVYLRLLGECLRLGRGAILLVPEIALTPQTVERLLGRLPGVAVLHSNLSDGDRARQWERLRSGEIQVAVGPRSAIFAPLPDVGLIILDEEHETTFKQQSSPRYHARDVARKRAELEGALLLLGSATPSLEAEHLCAQGRARRLSLPSRVCGRPMPTIVVVDMRAERPMAPGGIFSRPLYHSAQDVLDRGEQVLLFLNRRGFATTVLCRVCGWQGTCRRCAVNLTHYQKSDRLLCHYCGDEQVPPSTCPDCGHPGVRYRGFGTEKVAEAASLLFPGKRVARMDGETLRRRGAPERLFNALRSREIDVLVGTQVIAKGFDIPSIALVGVISADTALLVPDFRSAERTFQILCQVAGRAGRGDTPGRVLIQTYVPDHPAITAARNHDHVAFVAAELPHREALNYPPAGHLARIVIEATEAADALRHATRVKDALAADPLLTSGTLTLLGPAPCPIPLLKGLHRFHLLVQATDPEALTALLPKIPRRSSPRLRILIDRDPVAVM